MKQIIAGASVSPFYVGVIEGISLEEPTRKEPMWCINAIRGDDEFPLCKYTDPATASNDYLRCRQLIISSNQDTIYLNFQPKEKSEAPAPGKDEAENPQVVRGPEIVPEKEEAAE